MRRYDLPLGDPRSAGVKADAVTTSRATTDAAPSRGRGVAVRRIMALQNGAITGPNAEMVDAHAQW
jgi:hypothetical protein